MPPSSAFLLGIPAGALVVVCGAPFAVPVGLAGVALLLPRLDGRWKLLLAAGLLLGGGRAALIPPAIALPEGSVTVHARVDDVRESWAKTRYALGDAKTGSGAPLGSLSATVRSAYAAAEPGNVVMMRGVLKEPTPYLAAQGVVASLDDAAVFAVSPGPWAPFPALARLRRRAEAHLDSLLPIPQSALLSGLLLGTDERLPQEDADAFRAAGLSHLTAVSGSNVALILDLMAQALWWLPERWRLWPLLAGIGGFTLLVGAPASAVRAALTGIIGVLALRSGRRGGGRRALMLALAAMTLWEPRQLTADAGFQLSFLATLGIVELGPLLRALCAKVLPAGLAEALAVTLAAELPTLPWSAWTFDKMPILAPLTNLAAAPLSGIATMGGLALLGTSLLAPPLAMIARPLSWLSLTGLVQIGHLGADLGAHLPDPGAPPWPLLILVEGALVGAAMLAARLRPGTATPAARPATSAPAGPPPARSPAVGT
jgi:competence protein ComEC